MADGHAGWSTADIGDLHGRTAVVTGANTGLGYDTARVLAEHGATVVLAVRDTVTKGPEAAERIRATAPDADVSVAELDLGSLASVRSAAESLLAAHEKIDILVDNAGVMVPPQAETVDGFELQFGTNYLGHFAFTGLVLPALLATPGSRVVVVSSLMHKFGSIHFDDLQFTRKYNRSKAYAQSKLANIMFAYDLDEKLRAAKAQTISVAAHPGFTDSDLMRHVWAPVAPLVSLAGPLLGQPPAAGALPQLLAATAPFVEGGQYWGPDGIGELKGAPKLVSSSRRSKDRAVRRRLWGVAEELTGVTFPV